ncbi:SCO family protein [Marinobacter vulgaris]|uniref:SCO family protein n=1 Tax=Marinobacter vulgaris TaxID=1928331 RepID=A0A2V3ZPH5_9GAMM|nr:SCO family protein [Marinobacter vulgaris]PXX93297.1 SCO family protein [Marinobacter vulgaris]TSJ72691.1 SCO family protein [Marinobacter vulgaris]
MNKKAFTAAVMLLLAIGISGSLPLLAHVTKDSDFYGLRTDLSVPALPEYEPGPEKLRLVFFGYRHCGTVCPVQLVNLQDLHERLSHQPVSFVFVTLDPDRDSQQELDQTMTAMGPKFRAVRPENQLAAQNLALGFSDYAAKTGTADAYDYDHSARIYAVSPDNRRHLLYASPDLDLDRVQADIERLLAVL